MPTGTVSKSICGSTRKQLSLRCSTQNSMCLISPWTRAVHIASPTPRGSLRWKTRIDRTNEREKPIGKDRGFLWRLYSYWQFQEKDGGVYVQLESVALSRSVPALFAWVVNPLLKSIPREYLSRLLTSTRIAVTNKSVTSSFGTYAFVEQLSMKLFLIAPSSRAVQNEGHSRVILHILERSLCAPQES